MRTTMKVGIALTVIVFGLVVSPSVALSEAYSARQSEELEEAIYNYSIEKTVKIVGLDDYPFAPNSIDITKGETIVFLNVDGANGGMDHSITSAKIGTMEPDDTFKSGIIRIGQTFKVTFDKPGVYEYFDYTDPTVSGIINVR